MVRPRRRAVLVAVLIAVVLAVAVAELVAGRITARSLRRPDYGTSHVRRQPNPDRIEGPGMEWVRASPGSDRLPWQGDTESFQRGQFFDLAPEFAAMAIAELDRAPVVKLSAEQFRSYVGRPQHPGEKGQPFLVRGVEFEGVPGACDRIYREGPTLIVGCRINERPLRKRPMVVITEAVVDRVLFEFIFPV